MTNEEMRAEEMMNNEEIYAKLEELIDDARSACENCTSGSAEREKEVKNLKMLIDAREEMRSNDIEREDKEERRRIEEDKNKENAKIEMEKARKNWKGYLGDIGMTAFKGAVSLFGSLVILKVILEFEENGSIHSKPGRDFKFINPFKFIM